MYSTIQSSRLYEQIIEQIQNRIMEGKLRPGDKLPPERELAEQFGVSRNAVREAVKVLTKKGLVVVQPGRGTFVTDITDSTTGMMRDSLGLMVGIGPDNRLTDLIQLRAIIEPEIAAVAAAVATEEDILAMQLAIETMDAAMDSAEVNADMYTEADLDFHHTLAKATQNTLLPILIGPIVDLLREQRMRMARVDGAAQRGQYHHKRILKAIKRHDSAAARHAMQAHIDQILDDYDAASRLIE